MSTVETTEQIAYEALRLSVINFLNKNNYIKYDDIERAQRLNEDLQMDRTDVHIICNYVSVTYCVGFHPNEAYKYKTFGELIDFLFTKIQRI